MGRDAEREQLATLLDEAGPKVMWVHGVAGIGKSALLQRFVHDAERCGARCLYLDGREVEPTPEGFLVALGEAAQVGIQAPGIWPGFWRGGSRRL
nr:ATP-binding protein [Halomonas elongata]